MDFWLFIIGYASIQSLVLILLLSFRKGKSKQGLNNLVFLLIIIALIGLKYVLIKLGYHNGLPWLLSIDPSIWLLIGPLYFLFLSGTLGKKISFVTLLHFVPFLYFFITQLHSSWLGLNKWYFFSILASQMVIYAILSFIFLKRNSKII